MLAEKTWAFAMYLDRRNMHHSRTQRIPSESNSQNQSQLFSFTVNQCPSSIALADNIFNSYKFDREHMFYEDEYIIRYCPRIQAYPGHINDILNLSDTEVHRSTDDMFKPGLLQWFIKEKSNCRFSELSIYDSENTIKERIISKSTKSERKRYR